jgi:hypothetical protein
MNWLTHSEETRRGKILDSTANAQLMKTKSTSSKSPNRDRRTLRSSAKDQKYEFQKQKAPDPVTSGGKSQNHTPEQKNYFFIEIHMGLQLNHGDHHTHSLI